MQGEERCGWGSGWDLLLPKGWGMAFWLPLIYCGVRVGGLQMSLKHSQNKGSPHFPHDYPDCPAGARFQEQQENELLEKFKRYPPSKRTNYIKHGILTPFQCPWQKLVEEWEEIIKQERDTQDSKAVQMDIAASVFRKSPTSAFKVLRSRKVLRQLSVWCVPSSSYTRRLSRGSCTPSLTPMVARALQTEWERCLLWVRVCVLGKGRPALHAMLCVPTGEDLQQIRESLQCSGPIEPHHRDHIKSLKRKRKRDKATVHQTARKDCTSTCGKGSSSLSNSQPDSDLLPKQHCDQLVAPHPDPTSAAESLTVTGGCDPLPGLWTEPLPNISSHCSRMTLGWVTQGDFSLATGGGEALGFVSLVGFLHMLLSQPADLRGTMLLRNPSSLQYRYVRLRVEA